MGTLMQEVDYGDSDGNDENHLVDGDDIHDVHPQILHLQSQNSSLQMQLRSNEDRNHQLFVEIDQLRQENERLRLHLETSGEKNAISEHSYQEHIAYLENLVVKTKLKYKTMKKKYKGATHSYNSYASSEVDFGSELFYESFDHSSDVFPEKSTEDAESLKDEIQQQEEKNIKDLQLQLETKQMEIKQLEETINKYKQDIDQVSNKLKENENIVSLLRESLSEKESLLGCFKTEANVKIDEAIQYIKLIENEFHFDSSILPGSSEDNWEIEEKLDQFPSLIKKIYRDFVNIVFPSTGIKQGIATDVKPENINDQTVAATDSLQQSITATNQLQERKSNFNESHCTRKLSVELPIKQILTEKSQQDEKVGFMKMRKSGHPGYRRTISQEPTKQKFDVPVGLLRRRSSLSVKKDILSTFKLEETPDYPCFPTVTSQLQDNSFSVENDEKHFAMFLLALKSDRSNLIERVGMYFNI